MNENLLRLIMPALKTEKTDNGGDMGIILPLVLLLAVDSGDMLMIFAFSNTIIIVGIKRICKIMPGHAFRMVAETMGMVKDSRDLALERLIAMNVKA